MFSYPSACFTKEPKRVLLVSQVNKANSITHFFLIIVSVEKQQIQLCLSIALFAHNTSTFPLFSSLPSISLWGSEGREQGFFFFFFFLQMGKLKVTLDQWFSTLAAYWNHLKRFRKSLWSCHIPDQHQNLRVWNPSINIFQNTYNSKVQLRLRITGLDLYSVFRCNCLLPKCPFSSNEKEIPFPQTL